MYTEQYLRTRLRQMCEHAPHIHISVSLTKPHVEISERPAKLVGAYLHIFQIEEEKDGRLERRSMPYGEVIAGIVRIAELEE